MLGEGRPLAQAVVTLVEVANLRVCDRQVAGHGIAVVVFFPNLFLAVYLVVLFIAFVSDGVRATLAATLAEEMVPNGKGRKDCADAIDPEFPFCERANVGDFDASHFRDKEADTDAQEQGEAGVREELIHRLLSELLVLSIRTATHIAVWILFKHSFAYCHNKSVVFCSSIKVIPEWKVRLRIGREGRRGIAFLCRIVNTVYLCSIEAAVSEMMVKMRFYGVEVPKRSLNDRFHRAKPGRLQIKDSTDQGLHRMAKIARFVYTEEGHGPPDLLYDPVILWWNDGRCVLSGFERLKNSQGDVVDYAQSWLCFVGAVPPAIPEGR